MSFPRANDVQQYYDAFLESRMLAYRLNGGNERLDRAIERVLSVVRPGDSILDLGCGIGMVPERVSAKLGGEIRYWACDLSTRNIWYAEKTIRARNISFFAADIIHGFDDIVRKVDSVDVVTMVDVIEHIPEAHHSALFHNISRVTRPGARLVFTYPSPLYQAYLRNERPDALQIVDEVVDFQRLSQYAAERGFTLKHYSLEDVWMRNQYVHVVFENAATLDAVPPRNPGPAGRIRRQLRRIANGLLVRPYRKWKYVDRVFKHK